MHSPESFGILLVDDDPMAIRILNRMLVDFAPIRFATSGRAALKLARESAPDLVLLDVDMPGLSGFEVCSEFKNDPELAQIPIIFITSHESPQLESKGLALGGADFIRKPPHSSLVLARVRTHQRLKMLSDTMRNAVTMDFLTGAVTRRSLEKTLTQEWLRAQSSAASVSLLLIDIAGFTKINEELGEDGGDAYLKCLAEALRGVTHRPGDVLGRWGGGRFAILLPGTDAEGLAIVTRRVAEAVGGLRVPARISVRVGGACSDSSPEALVAAAEEALNEARGSDQSLHCAG